MEYRRHLMTAVELKKTNEQLISENVRLKEINDVLKRDNAFLLKKLDFFYTKGFEYLNDDIL